MRFNIVTRRSTRPRPGHTMPHYFHYQLENPGTDVYIAAWQCPVIAPADVDEEWFERNCTLPLDNVNFAIKGHDVSGSSSPVTSLTTTRLDPADIRVAATQAVGYAPEPHMMCALLPQDDEGTPGSTPSIRCNWYTWQLTPGEITVYAWECPDGYDFTAEHADPMEDCVGIANRVQYRLTNSQPDHELQLHTGAWRTGAAHVDNLEPGHYTLTEIRSPDAEHDTILWQCFGVAGETAHSPARPSPDVSFSINGGEHIMCHRFHIPHNRGTVTH